MKSVFPEVYKALQEETLDIITDIFPGEVNQIRDASRELNWNNSV